MSKSMKIVEMANKKQDIALSELARKIGSSPKKTARLLATVCYRFGIGAYTFANGRGRTVRFYQAA